MINENCVLVKNDINLLEYPIWTLSEKKKEFVIEKDKGTYRIMSALSLPSDNDILIHYFILSKAFDKKTQKYKNQIVTTRYEIAMNVFNTRNNFIYERIIEGLSKWTAVFVEFKGIFYDGEKYSSRGFHFIESYKIDDTGELEITLNSQYVEHLNNTTYYQQIDFNKIKKLKRAVSKRLYEILVKTFRQKDCWNIGVLKLAEKLTLNRKYPSQIVQKIIPAINEINANTELKIKFDYDQETGICVFTKFDNAELITISKPTKNKEGNYDIPASILKIIPIKYRINSTFKIIVSYLSGGASEEYITSNIFYTEKHAKKNFPIYLKKALIDDYARADRELLVKARELEEQRQKFFEKEKAIEEERKLFAAEKEQKEDEKIHLLITQLPEHEREKIEKLSKENLNRFPPIGKNIDEEVKKMYKINAYKILNNISLRKL